MRVWYDDKDAFARDSRCVLKRIRDLESTIYEGTGESHWLTELRELDKDMLRRDMSLSQELSFYRTQQKKITDKHEAEIKAAREALAESLQRLTVVESQIAAKNANEPDSQAAMHSNIDRLYERVDDLREGQADAATKVDSMRTSISSLRVQLSEIQHAQATNRGRVETVSGEAAQGPVQSNRSGNSSHTPSASQHIYEGTGDQLDFHALANGGMEQMFSSIPESRPNPSSQFQSPRVHGPQGFAGGDMPMNREQAQQFQSAVRQEPRNSNRDDQFSRSNSAERFQQQRFSNDIGQAFSSHTGQVFGNSTSAEYGNGVSADVIQQRNFGRPEAVPRHLNGQYVDTPAPMVTARGWQPDSVPPNLQPTNIFSPTHGQQGQALLPPQFFPSQNPNFHPAYGTTGINQMAMDNTQLGRLTRAITEPTNGTYMTQVLPSNEHILLKMLTTASVISFLTKVYDFCTANQVAFRLTSKVTAECREQILSRNEGFVDEVSFNTLSNAQLLRCLQRTVQPKSRDEFVLVITSSVRFHMRGSDPISVRTFQGFYDALSSYKRQWLLYFDFMSYENAANVPHCNSKDNGLISLFIKPIPGDYAKNRYNTLINKKYNDIKHFIADMWSQVQMDYERFKQYQTLTTVVGDVVPGFDYKSAPPSPAKSNDKKPPPSPQKNPF
jgi:hypothetical protein